MAPIWCPYIARPLNVCSNKGLLHSRVIETVDSKFFLKWTIEMILSTVIETVDSMSYLKWTTETNLSTVMETVDSVSYIEWTTEMNLLTVWNICTTLERGQI